VLADVSILGKHRGKHTSERDTSKRQLREKLDSISWVNRWTASFPLPWKRGFESGAVGQDSDAQGEIREFPGADLQGRSTRLLRVDGHEAAGRTDLHTGRQLRGTVVLMYEARRRERYKPVGRGQANHYLSVSARLKPQWVRIIRCGGHQRNTSLGEPGREQLYVADGYLNHGCHAYWWRYIFSLKLIVSRRRLLILARK